MKGISKEKNAIHLQAIAGQPGRDGGSGTDAAQEKVRGRSCRVPTEHRKRCPEGPVQDLGALRLSIVARFRKRQIESEG